MSKKGSKGFTLLELIIVVGIIGVLAAISATKLAQLIDKAREAATKANLGALRASISIYFADNKGMWPRKLDSEKWISGGETFAAFIPTYIQKIPRATLQRSNPHSRENENKIVYVATEEIYGKITPEQITDEGGWIYSSNGGEIRVNCNHRDSTALTDSNSTIYYSNYGHEI